jgi:hypothetical protein
LVLLLVALALLSTSVLCFDDLASIMVESSCYCQSCDRNLLINIYCWSPPTARGNEVSGYVILADHSICSCWRALNICICHFSVHWSSFLSVVFDFWGILFFTVGDGCWIWCTFQSSYLVISFWIQVDDKMYCIHNFCTYEYGVWSGLEFQSLMLSVVMCPCEFDLLYVMSLSVNLIIMQLFCIYRVQ